MNLNAALETAWGKIQAYCKENFAGVSCRDIQFGWKHDVYGWTEFGITPNGDAYFVSGDHSQSSRDANADWYYHPDHKAGYVFTKHARMEEVVRDWPIIKEKLLQAVRVERSIFNFEV